MDRSPHPLRRPCSNWHSLSVGICLAVATANGCQRLDDEINKPQLAGEKTSMTDYAKLSENELSERWKTATREYVSGINELVDRGIASNWQDMEGAKEPEDTREPMADAVIAAVRRASERGDLNIHEKFPRAHGPFIKYLEENGQSIPIVCCLDGGRIVIGWEHRIKTDGCF